MSHQHPTQEQIASKTVRQAVMREGPDYHDDPLIMNVARMCGKCTRDYLNDEACNACPYNPAQYTDHRRAMLMRLNTTAPVSDYYSEVRRGVLVQVIVVAALVIAMIFGCARLAYGQQRDDWRGWLPQPPETSLPESNFGSGGLSSIPDSVIAPAWNTPATVTQPSPRPAPAVVDETPAVLEAIRRTKEHVRDVSGDGIVNCQDYAAIFLWFYPEAEIVHNAYIGPTGHLFNRVKIKGSWVYIEPQMPNGYWLMHEAWTIYNQVKQHNEVATSTWTRR